MPRRSSVLIATALLATAATVHAQTAPAGPAFEAAGGETARHQASDRASARAIALCSGLWSGHLGMAQIDATDPPLPQDAFTTVIDEEAKVVSVAYDAAMPPRLAAFRPVLGCVQAPPGATRDDLSLYPAIDPSVVRPDLDAQKWPMGDRDAKGKLPGKARASLDRIVEAAFDDETYKGDTWAVLIVKDGKIVAEKYAPGYDMHSADQTHSAAKSFAVSVIGLGVRDYDFDIDAAPAIEAWSHPGDPRGAITVKHLLRMSSGLYGEGNGMPLMDIYRSGAAIEQIATANLLDTMPGTRFLYNPPDTMLAVHALREKVADDKAFDALPFTELFWKIGMTRTTPSSDWNGDFMMSGQTYSSARDFARFGLLMLGDGVWQGERILPEGWVDFVRTPGPVQPAGQRGYGAQFWLYGGIEGLPEGVFAASGGGGQSITVVPSHDLVVVRRGHDGFTGGFAIERFTKDVIDALAK